MMAIFLNDLYNKMPHHNLSFHIIKEAFENKKIEFLGRYFESV